MAPKKSVSAPQQRPLPGSEPEPIARAASTGGRKPWIRRTPVEVVLEQITKQEDRVEGLREELAKEERELKKLQQAKNVLEST